MKANLSMKSLLQKYLIDSISCIPQNNAYPIWHKTDIAGRVYWGVASFCGLDEYPISSEQDLSQLEWDGNEIYLDAYTEEDIAEMLKKAIGILLFWKDELGNKYSDTSFYIFASYDNGDMLALDEGETPIRSITMRFWADRGENTVINLSDFNRWDQPAIMEHIISNAPPKT